MGARAAGSAGARCARVRRERREERRASQSTHSAHPPTGAAAAEAEPPAASACWASWREVAAGGCEGRPPASQPRANRTRSRRRPPFAAACSAPAGEPDVSRRSLPQLLAAARLRDPRRPSVAEAGAPAAGAQVGAPPSEGRRRARSAARRAERGRRAALPRLAMRVALPRVGDDRLRRRGVLGDLVLPGVRYGRVRVVVVGVRAYASVAPRDERGVARVERRLLRERARDLCVPRRLELAPFVTDRLEHELRRMQARAVSAAAGSEHSRAKP